VGRDQGRILRTGEESPVELLTTYISDYVIGAIDRQCQQIIADADARAAWCDARADFEELTRNEVGRQ
jgi:hypothetical protein